MPIEKQLPDATEIEIGQEKIVPKACVKNLGAFLDQEMNMQDQIKNIRKLCYASLYNIGRIRKYLDRENVETLIHAFITCRLDNLNVLLPCTSDHVKFHEQAADDHEQMLLE